MAVDADICPRSGDRFKQFPPGRAGVLLPETSKRTAALGLCLYTASRPTALLVQGLAFSLTRMFGVRVLPGSPQRWSPDLDQWQTLLNTWQKEVGQFDSFAVYQRRQASRTGLTVLLVNGGTPVAVTKVRDSPDALALEQRALGAIRRAQLKTFHAPEPLGSGDLGNGTYWSAQTAVFDAPHRPVFKAPATMFGEITDALSSIVETTSATQAAHNDLTPWNLRVDQASRVWLFDWEDVGPAPVDSDRCYFSASSFALRGTAMPKDLAVDAIDHWLPIVSARRPRSGPDRRLGDSLLRALDIARATRAVQQVVVDPSS